MRWLGRHMVVGALSAVGAYAIFLSRPETGSMQMHSLNRAFADVALFLLAFALAIGPISRLWSPIRRLIPWRREIGIWSGVTSVAHVVVILDGWIHWDLTRLFWDYRGPNLGWVLDKSAFGLGNLVGVIALLYIVLLAVTSSDWSTRLLGSSAWKFVQQRSYTLFVLVGLHTAFFLFWYQPRANWLSIPFLLMAGGIPALQALAFAKILRGRLHPGLGASHEDV